MAYENPLFARLRRIFSADEDVAEGPPPALVIPEHAPPVAGDDLQLAQLLERIESEVCAFAAATTEARSATTDYRTALADHVEELHGLDAASAMIGQLTQLSRAMLERTARIEERFAESEREIGALRGRLDEAKRASEIDHLTELPNRRAFEAAFAAAHVAMVRDHTPLCVAFCDIDHFKKVNDTHGHEAGDRVLRFVARILSEFFAESCHVARHGGEEFVVLFIDVPIEIAQFRLDQARAALSERRLINRATDVPFGAVTLSAGLADVAAYRDPREALKAADEALYVAKEGGRNRIQVALPHRANAA